MMDGRVVKWWCSDLSSHQSPGTCSCFSRHPAVLWSCGATWQNLRRVTPTSNNKIILRPAQQLIPYFEIVTQLLSCPRQSPLLQRSECCHPVISTPGQQWLVIPCPALTRWAGSHTAVITLQHWQVVPATLSHMHHYIIPSHPGARKNLTPNTVAYIYCVVNC